MNKLGYSPITKELSFVQHDQYHLVAEYSQ